MSLDNKQKRLLSLAREYGTLHFNPETKLCLIPRDTVWFAISLALSDVETERRTGHQLFAEARNEDNTHTPATMIAILHAMNNTIGDSVRSHLKKCVEDSLVGAALVEWHDGNVNHPLAAWCTLICGGEMSRREDYTELGVKRLQRFRYVIGNRRHGARRQSEMSEYNSLTYSALDILFLAIIAEYAYRDDARELALFLERQLWRDMSMHYHAPSGQFAGPHSRSYLDDSSGGYSAMHVLWYRVFDDVHLNPSVAVRFNHPSNILQNALAAIVPIHPPDDCTEIAWRKPFPYSIRMWTYGEAYHENHTRHTSDHEIYPGGWSELVTHMTHEYALGTASLPYVNAGHSDSFMLRIAGETENDFRSIHTRGVFNDSTAGQRNHCHVTDGPIDESYLYEEGRSFIAHEKSVAIVCYHPKRSGNNDVKRFRLDIICSSDSDFDRCLVEGSDVNLPYESSTLHRIVLKHHRTYLALLPLSLSPMSERPLRLWKSNGFLMISLFNHDGQTLNLLRDEMTSWRNGFIIELGTTTEFESIEQFDDHIASSSISDAFNGRTRSVTYRSGDTELAFVYDPFAERIISTTLNGRSREHDGMIIEAGDEGFKPQTLFGLEAME